MAFLKKRMRIAPFCVLLLASACAPDASGPEVYFDLSGQTNTPSSFFNAPFPSDLRLDNQGRMDYTGHPNPKDSAPVRDLIEGAARHEGASTMTAVTFRFRGPLAERMDTDAIAPNIDSPFLIVDIDPESPERGRLFPAVAKTLPVDGYLAEYGLAVAPWPGIILPTRRTFATIVMRDANDALGAPLGVPDELATLAADAVPEGALGQAAADLYAPMFETLDMLGIDRGEVAAASVFTTADVVQDLSDLSTALVEKYDIAIEDIALDPDDGDHPTFCELVATIEFPQFQEGTPPFNDQGLFAPGADGLPIVQRQKRVPAHIVIPKTEMPSGGYPLVIYFHGSGGYSAQVVDLGKIKVEGGSPTVGEGPSLVLAEHGIASAGSALPVNPERLPGASAYEYLNFSNLPAMRDTFRQGVIEQRLFIEELLRVEIPPSALGACAGPSLPNGETGYRFHAGELMALGLSMGGAYTNIIGAVEPKIGAVVPAGAGGLWHRFVLDTDILDNAGALISILLGSDSELSFLHPAMQLPAMAWEAVEPMVYMQRLAKRPLPGHPVRDIYEPVGQNDRFFDSKTFDAAALSYGNQQAGNQLWPTMQDALALLGLDGVATYPVTNNGESHEGEAHTGLVVQFEGDGLQDPHVIFAQLDEVKHQYGCFFRSYLDDGAATVPAPAPLGTPCQ
jgi:hypothetical protein